MKKSLAILLLAVLFVGSELQAQDNAQKVEVPEEATIKKVAQEVSLLIKNTFQPASGGFGVASGWVVS